MLSYTPQVQSDSSIQLADSINWMKIEDTIATNGTEAYMIIGNFKTDAASDTSYIGWFSTSNIAYYYIDDVSVIDVESLGLNAQILEKRILVYPNPTEGTVFVQCSLASAELSVIDLLGNIVMREVFSNQKRIEFGDFLQEFTF
jgi:hypothetical protein